MTFNIHQITKQTQPFTKIEPSWEQNL